MIKLIHFETVGTELIDTNLVHTNLVYVYVKIQAPGSVYIVL